MPKKSKSKRRNRGRGPEENQMVIPRNLWGRGGGSALSAKPVFRNLTYVPTAVAAAAYAFYDESILSSTSEWANLSAVYGSVRLLGIKVILPPQTTATGSIGTYICCTYRNGTVPASTAASLVGSENSKVYPVDYTNKQVLAYTAYANGATAFLFQPIGTLASRTGVKFLNGGSASCNVIVQFAVEFLGRIN